MNPHLPGICFGVFVRVCENISRPARARADDNGDVVSDRRLGILDGVSTPLHHDQHHRNSQTALCYGHVACRIVHNELDKI